MPQQQEHQQMLHHNSNLGELAMQLTTSIFYEHKLLHESCLTSCTPVSLENLASSIQKQQSASKQFCSKPLCAKHKRQHLCDDLEDATHLPLSSWPSSTRLPLLSSTGHCCLSASMRVTYLAMTSGLQIYNIVACNLSWKQQIND